MRNEGMAEHMKDNGNERRGRWNEPGENQKVKRLVFSVFTQSGRLKIYVMVQG